MTTPATTRPSHKFQSLLFFLFLFFPMLACKTFIPATPTAAPEKSDGIKVNYPTGIETIRLDNGMIVAADAKGYYCMAFPVEWEVGAFHEDFIPTVDKYAQIHGGIKLLFDAIYGKDNSLRIFAIDTASNHLSETNMTVVHVGMFQEEWRLKLTLDEITAEYMAYVTSSGQLKVTNTFLGKSKYDIPYILLLTESAPPDNQLPVYGGAALVKTDYAYLEIIYTTLDKSTQIAEEMYPFLNSFTTCAD